LLINKLQLRIDKTKVSFFKFLAEQIDNKGIKKAVDETEKNPTVELKISSTDVKEYKKESKDSIINFLIIIDNNIIKVNRNLAFCLSQTAYNAIKANLDIKNILLKIFLILFFKTFYLIF
jgi:hypothetical protein